MKAGARSSHGGPRPRAAAAAIEVTGQQSEEGREVGLLEFLGRRELPQQGPEPVAQLGHAGIEETGDRFAGIAEFAPMGDEPRPLDREHEILRNLARPLAIGRGRLGAVEGAVDLDRGEVARGIAELLRMGQAFGIEHAAPRREGPPADADVNASVFFAIRDPLRNLVSPPISEWKAGLSPHGAPSRDHDFELVTPDVRAPLNSWSFWFQAASTRARELPL